jgi:hypothetical protein
MRRQLQVTLLVGTLTLASALARAATPTGATEEEKQAAQKMFEAGDGLYESRRYDDAIVAFKNSHSLVASPNSRLMLARSLREAGRSAEASEEFRGTIRDAEASGGRYPEALQAAQSELKALEASLGHIELAQKLRAQIAEVSINGRPIAVSEAPIPVVAGTVRIEYRLKDGSSHSTTIGLAQGESKTVDASESIVAKPVTAAPSRPTTTARAASAPGRDSGGNVLRTAAWVSAGVGVLGLSAFGIFGYLNRKTYDDLESECPNGTCPASSMDKVDAGRRYQLLANVGLGVAVVGTAAATTLFVLSLGKKSDSPMLALGVFAGGVRLDAQF